MDEPIIVDTGSSQTRVGVAGREAPYETFPTVTGLPRSGLQRLMPTDRNESSSANDRDRDARQKPIIGRSALDKHSLLELKRPVQRGRVQDWNQVTQVWEAALSAESLLLDAGGSPGAVEKHAMSTSSSSDPSATLLDNRPVLLIDSPFSGKGSRDLCAQIWFETFNTRQLYIGKSSVMALYGCGETAGLVLECGDGLTAISAAYESCPIPKAAAKVPVAGQDLTQYLSRLLLDSTPMSTDSLRGLRDALAQSRFSSSHLCYGWPSEAKERHCAVALDYRAELQQSRVPLSLGKASVSGRHAAAPSDGSSDGGSNGSPPPLCDQQFTLPDGSTVTIEAAVTRQVPEALFQPSLILGHATAGACDVNSGGINSDGAVGIGGAIEAVLRTLDPELRAQLPGTLVLSGGTTLLPGLPERVELEAHAALKRCGVSSGQAAASAATASSGGGGHVRVIARPDRAYGAFVGGSVLGSLSRFSDMCLTRAEYEEEGPRAVKAKFYA